MGTEMNLGRRIREVRLQKKLTQNDVVGEYMTRNMLSKIENGSATPSVRTLEFLSETLDVPVGYFLDGSDREPADVEQLRAIDELACLLAQSDGPQPALALCVRARTRLAAGRPDAALALFEGFDEDHDRVSEQALQQVYMVMEDCYKLKGNYKLAYEYALKRLGE